jgi:hypothetical protein
MSDSKTKIPASILPKGITPDDLEYNCPRSASAAAWKKWRNANELVELRNLQMYFTERFGWCITTLFIKGAGRQDTARYYGITTTGQPVRIGHGPHVKHEAHVYLRKSRVAALQPYIDLYNKGLEDAHNTRDRISTRRVMTTMRRANFNF